MNFDDSHHLAGADAAAAAPWRLAPQALFDDNLLAHRSVFESVAALRSQVCEAAARITECLRLGGRLLLFGNGGSASDALHLSAEFNGRLRRERAPIAAMALTADPATLTAIANDYGYEEVFARQLYAHGRPGDCALALSTSGRSPNVLRGLVAAAGQGMTTVALLGGDGGLARSLADLSVVVPHGDSARVQEAHIFIGHTWCGQIERALGLLA